MLWRGTVHFFQARKMVISIQRGATMVRAVKCIRVAEGTAAGDMTGRSMKPQEV
jgi:hypothetical protein